MTERCYRCGRVKCETCGGSGVRGGVPDFIGDRPGKIGRGQTCSACPDCKDGWREAEVLRYGVDLACEDPKCGNDPSILCPMCEKIEATGEPQESV